MIIPTLQKEYNTCNIDNITYVPVCFKILHFDTSYSTLALPSIIYSYDSCIIEIIVKKNGQIETFLFIIHFIHTSV